MTTNQVAPMRVADACAFLQRTPEQLDALIARGEIAERAVGGERWIFVAIGEPLRDALEEQAARREARRNAQLGEQRRRESEALEAEQRERAKGKVRAELALVANGGRTGADLAAERANRQANAEGKEHEAEKARREAAEKRQRDELVAEIRREDASREQRAREQAEADRQRKLERAARSEQRASGAIAAVRSKLARLVGVVGQ